MVSSEWSVGPEAWSAFVKRHPELAFKCGKWPFHNFLRLHRDRLIARDAIRKARGRYWIAHVDRFAAAAFDCATGVAGPQPSEDKSC